MTVLFADRRWELERGVGKRLRAPGLRVPLLRAVFPALWAVKRKDGVGQGVFISKSQARHIDSVPLGVSCRIHRFCRHQLVSLSPSPGKLQSFPQVPVGGSSGESRGWGVWGTVVPTQEDRQTRAGGLVQALLLLVGEIWGLLDIVLSSGHKV